MSVYLARIEQVNEYYNVRPVLELNEEGYYEVDEDKFGQYGTITISAIYGTANTSYIQDQKYYIFSISDSELNSLEQNSSGYKIKAIDFIPKCKSVDSSVIREVISLSDTYDIDNFEVWRESPIYGIIPPISRTVYLSDNYQVIGPFTWEEISENGYIFTPNSPNGDPYLIDCYDKNDVQDQIYIFDAAKKSYDLYAGCVRHIIRLEELPENKIKIDCINDDGLKEFVSRLLSEQTDSRKEKRDIKSAVMALPKERLTDSRKERIVKLVKNGELADQTIKLIPNVLMSDVNTIQPLIDVILGNVDYLNKIYPVIKTQEGFHVELERIEKEKNIKEEELKALELKIELVKNSSGLDFGESKVIFDELSAENKDLKEQLEKFQSLEDVQFEYEKRQKLFEEAKKNHDSYSGVNNMLEEEIKKKVQAGYASIAFDGALSSILMSEAANFERKNRKIKMKKVIASYTDIKDKSNIQNAIDLIDFLYKELVYKCKRNITKNDIANIIICVSQGFLTIFAGEPGTGKTSLVSLLANILGLNNNQNPRYVEIAVEKGWTSRRDLIGYYNPLTKTFDASNKGMFEALSILKVEEELKGYEFPYWILLDEANLSQMEHYWADFMSACDLDKKKRRISLSEEYDFPIANNLRFLATINLDHTTEILSPRLIDRSWIIKLYATDIDIEDYEEGLIDLEYPIISFDIFDKLNKSECWKSSKMDASLVEKFNRIRAIYHDVGINFSPRTIRMIKRYCLASKDLMDISENSYVSLDYAVAQKILPMIDGYGDKYKEFLEKLMKECDSGTMPICSNLLQSIKEKGSFNMQYYQFFAR